MVAGSSTPTDRAAALTPCTKSAAPLYPTRPQAFPLIRADGSGHCGPLIALRVGELRDLRAAALTPCTKSAAPLYPTRPQAFPLIRADGSGHCGPLIALTVGELRALRWGGVDLKVRLRRVLETVYDGHFDKPKTKGGLCTIPIGAETAASLATRLQAAWTGVPSMLRNRKIEREWGARHGYSNR